VSLRDGYEKCHFEVSFVHGGVWPDLIFASHLIK